MADGETPTASQQADALDVLNDILEEWSNDGFMIFEKKIEEFTLNASDGVYSIGSGADFDTVRPTLIEMAKIKDAVDSYELPLKIWNAQEWAGITLKTTESTFPEGLYYNPKYPNGEISLWPVPSAANKLVLYSEKPLTAIASAATTLSYPPGYKKALKYELGIELAPEYGKSVDAKTEDIWKKSKASIARTNTEPVLMTSDAAGLTSRKAYDWRIGE
ncbi:MAG: hypothetical protein AB7G93_09525 [Bdellovibrionales bacterium]